MAKTTYNITAVRGDTVKSPIWMITNEELPDGIEWWELEDGLDSGLYTLMDLSQYSIRGHVRASPTGEIVYNLPLVIEDDRMSFTLHYTMTETLNNLNTTLVYDIEFTHIADNERVTWVAGTLTITPDVTYSDSFRRGR